MGNNIATPRGPDYGTVTVLRGFPNFEDYYQGLHRGYPVALTDRLSRTMGRSNVASANYQALSGILAQQMPGGGPSADGNVDGATSPELLEGVPVTMGANLIFCFPRPITTGTPLVYKIIWRIRSIDTQDGTPFHDVLSGYRYIDGWTNSPEGMDSSPPVFGGKAAQRAVIATISETVRYTSPPGTGGVQPYAGQQIPRDLVLTPDPSYAWMDEVGDGAMAYGPVLPFAGGNADTNPVTGRTFTMGEFGQNPLASSGVSSLDGLFRAGVSHISYSTIAKGDEAIVLVYPRLLNVNSEGALGTYDFDNVDTGEFFLSCYFGRGGYAAPPAIGRVLFPQGTPFGVYLLQGISLGGKSPLVVLGEASQTVGLGGFGGLRDGWFAARARRSW